MKRTLLTSATVAAVTLILSAAASGDDPWRFLVGDERTHVGSRADDPNTLRVFALDDLNLSAGHIRLEGRDGNVELESPAAFAATRLTPYDIGTPNRKPLEVGGDDGQDVVSLIVGGKRKQTNPLQLWRASGGEVAALTADGSLRLRGVRLSLQVRRGVVYLVAITPDGRRQTLRFNP